MEGKLHLNENKQWVIKYTECHPKRIVTQYNMTVPLHHNDQELMVGRNPDLWNGRDVSFEIRKDYIDLHSNETQIYAQQIKLIKPINENTQNTNDWDDIFYYIENSLHAELPHRVKNWLTNKYNKPELKYENKSK